MSASVEVEYNRRIYKGRGVSTDVIEASAFAFLNAINTIKMTEAMEIEKTTSPQDPALENATV